MGADAAVSSVDPGAERARPGQNGLSLAEHAHSIGAIVILMSGDPDAMTALDRLAHHGLYKLFRPAELIAVVDEAASRRATRLLARL